MRKQISQLKSFDLSGYIKSHPTVVSALIYLGVAVFASYIFYLRFPGAFHHANFYAEDAEYVTNIIDQGILASILTPFNGYLIVGIYLMHSAAFILNHILFDGTILSLPQSISIVSYAFLGFCAALPVLFLRRRLNPIALVWLVAMTTLIPLPTMDYGVLGNTANLKFIFLYVALLLTIYRHYLPENSRRFLIIDALLLLCCLTNIICIILLPFLIWRYVPSILQGKKGFMSLLRNRSFVSLSLLFAVIFVMLSCVILLGEVKPIGGIYDRPYQWQSTIEVFLGRSFLFGFSPYSYSHLSNLLTVFLTIIFITGCMIFCTKKYRYAVICSLLGVILATTLVLWSRPGISTLFGSYSSAGYDQYFFAQNIMIYLVAAFALSGAMRYFRSNQIALSVVVLLPFVLLLQIQFPGSLGASGFMAKTRGTFINNALEACEQQRDKVLKITTYPQPPFVIILDRDLVCDNLSTNTTHPTIAKTNLEPAGDALIFKPGISDGFTQTFFSDSNGLRGVAIHVVTYEKPLSDTYQFVLMDQSCQEVYYILPLNNLLTMDGTYYPVMFPRQNDSENKRYCFRVEGRNTQGTQPFAIRLSQPGRYEMGDAIINSIPSDRDVVFFLIY